MTWPGKAYTSEAITVLFDGSRCRHFAECVHGLPAVFDTSARPWVQPANAAPQLVAEVVRRCPSGALHYDFDVPEQPSVPTTAEVVEGGPLLLRGDLEIRTSTGTVRDVRAAVCRCGRSARQPWCDAACENSGVAADPKQ